MSEQITFATSDFASNPEPRCPCILLLDVSGSMNGRPINELNAGLVTFRDELLADSLALKRVELGIVTFGPVHVGQPFTSAANFFPPILFAQVAIHQWALPLPKPWIWLRSGNVNIVPMVFPIIVRGFS